MLPSEEGCDKNIINQVRTFLILYIQPAPTLPFTQLTKEQCVGKQFLHDIRPQAKQTDFKETCIPTSLSLGFESIQRLGLRSTEHSKQSKNNSNMLEDIHHC